MDAVHYSIILFILVVARAGHIAPEAVTSGRIGNHVLRMFLELYTLFISVKCLRLLLNIFLVSL